MTAKRIVAAVCGALLLFPLSALAMSEATVEAARREAEYAKAKADTAAHQAREAKSNAEKALAEKAIAASGAAGDARKADK